MIGRLVQADVPNGTAVQLTLQLTEKLLARQLRAR
jgi:hypothetical protein